MTGTATIIRMDIRMDIRKDIRKDIRMVTAGTGMFTRR
jgi:hypothetical protein